MIFRTLFLVLALLSSTEAGTFQGARPVANRNLESSPSRGAVRQQKEDAREDRAAFKAPHRDDYRGDQHESADCVGSVVASVGTCIM